MPRHAHSDHVQVGARFVHQRQRRSDVRYDQRQELATVALLLTLLAMVVVLAGCRKAVNPQTVVDQIRGEMRRGQLDSAQQHAETAFAKYQSDPQWGPQFLVWKAHVLFLRSAYNEALLLLEPDLPTQFARSDTAVHRRLVQGLARIYLQQYDAADKLLTEAESLAHSLNSTFTGDVAQARGILEIDQKHYPQAEAAFQHSLSFAREKNLPFLEVLALGNLGNVAMFREHYDEAIDRYRLVLQKSQSVGSLSSISRALGNMGWSYSVVGDFDNAESALREAQAKAAQAGLKDDQVYWLTSLAGIYAQQRRYPEANAAAQEAVALAEKSDDKNTLTTCLNTGSEIALALGHLEEAEKSNREALQIENAGLDHFGITRSQLIAGRIAAGRHNYSEAARAFQSVAADSNAQTPAKWEAHARLADVYVAQRQDGRAQQEFDIAIRTVENARRAVERDEFRVSFLSSAIEFYGAYVNFLIDRGQTLAALRIADLARSQALESGLAEDSVVRGSHKDVLQAQEIARRHDASLLFYWLGAERSWLWVITPEKTSLFPLPGSSELETLVKNYRQAFLEPRDPVDAGNPDGKKLYAALVAPAERLLAGRSRVIALPDGPLNSLNFETLIVPGTPAHYWIEDVTITTANSLALLSRSSDASPPKDGQLLIVGDALPASPDFPPLPQAGKEVSLLENYFSADQRQELTRENATTGKFLASRPERFSFLHFATHGTASRTRPLESAVILSPEGDSYKLYAREVLQHPLQAYLVTISACNGAGTKSYAGEGLVGLSWAFLRAGAHHVIAGLWEVSNASTPQLMDELYKGLSRGQDPATALRNAKLALLHSSGNYRRPFYWAPFLLYSGS